MLFKAVVAEGYTVEAVFFRVVAGKGAAEDRCAGDCLVEDFKLLGYNQVILKCDNEKII